MLRLDQEAMKALFQPTLRAIIEVNIGDNYWDLKD